jgi:hypothetical protein
VLLARRTAAARLWGAQAVGTDQLAQRPRRTSARMVRAGAIAAPHLLL